MPTSKKAPAKKKPTAKKAVAAKTRKSPQKQSLAHRSFRLSFDHTPFLTFRLTRQTFYWVILCAVIFFFGTWIINLQMQIQDIYNQVDANSNDLTTLLPTRAAVHK